MLSIKCLADTQFDICIPFYHFKPISVPFLFSKWFFNITKNKQQHWFILCQWFGLKIPPEETAYKNMMWAIWSQTEKQKLGAWNSMSLIVWFTANKPSEMSFSKLRKYSGLFLCVFGLTVAKTLKCNEFYGEELERKKNTLRKASSLFSHVMMLDSCS